MIAYEFCVDDGTEEFHLLGILPERRKDPSRVTYQSIMNWAILLVDDSVDIDEIHIIQAEI